MFNVNNVQDDVTPAGVTEACWESGDFRHCRYLGQDLLTPIQCGDRL